MRKYLVHFYTGFYIFSVGEVVPRASTTEFCVSFLLLSFCMIVNALIIGEITAYLDDLSKKSNAFSAKINLMNTSMINLNLSRPLKNEIKKFINQTHTTFTLQDELDGFIKGLSASYQLQVTKCSFMVLAQQNQLLKRLAETRMEAMLKQSATQASMKMLSRKGKKLLYDKIVGNLVQNLVNVFTQPDERYI